jgi:copper homeostasis protein CutC
MLRWHADTIDILPGGGIRPANVQLYRDLGFKEVHSSCRNDLGQLDISQVKHMAEVMKGVVL